MSEYSAVLGSGWTSPPLADHCTRWRSGPSSARSSAPTTRARTPRAGAARRRGRIRRTRTGEPSSRVSRTATAMLSSIRHATLLDIRLSLGSPVGAKYGVAPRGERRGNPQVVLRGAPPVARGHRRGTIPITGSPRRARLSRTSAGFGLTATSASASRAPRHGKLGPRSIRAGAFPPGHEVRAGLAGAHGGLRSRDRDRRRQTPVRSGMAGRCSEAARGP